MTSWRTSLAQSPARLLAGIGAVLVVLAFAAPAFHHRFGGIAWLCLLLIWALLAFAAIKVADGVSRTTGLVIICGSAALLRLALLTQTPYLSSDIYRYIWDGRVQAAGINPYIHLPSAPQLTALRDDKIFPNINRADYAPTIYPPVAQMFFRLIAGFSDGLIGMKLGLLVCEAIAVGQHNSELLERIRPADAPQCVTSKMPHDRV